MTKASKVVVTTLNEMKAAGESITMLTAYDFTFAGEMDRAGIDVILVGDSLGNVIQGHATTLPVRLKHLVYHSRAVSTAARRALVLADIPFLEDHSAASAAKAAQALMGKGGAGMVKIEGAGPMLDTIEYLSARGVPVCAHLGLTPQFVHQLGGYRVQGKDADSQQQILEDARAAQAAGARMLVLECVPDNLAKEITKELAIPTIGIGAGPHCDGQVLVLHDLLGLGEHRPPRFVKNFLAGNDSVSGAIKQYIAEVRSGEFPSAEHSYGDM